MNDRGRIVGFGTALAFLLLVCTFQLTVVQLSGNPRPSLRSASTVTKGTKSEPMREVKTFVRKAKRSIRRSLKRQFQFQHPA